MTDTRTLPDVLSYEEIAAALGVEPHTVKDAKWAALLKGRV